MEGRKEIETIRESETEIYSEIVNCVEVDRTILYRDLCRKDEDGKAGKQSKLHEMQSLLYLSCATIK